MARASEAAQLDPGLGSRRVPVGADPSTGLHRMPLQVDAAELPFLLYDGFSTSPALTTRGRELPVGSPRGLGAWESKDVAEMHDGEEMEMITETSFNFLPE
jgi:hypothetical protein